MPLVPSVVRGVLVPWSIAAVIVSSSSVGASTGGAAQERKNRGSSLLAMSPHPGFDDWSRD